MDFDAGLWHLTEVFHLSEQYMFELLHTDLWRGIRDFSEVTDEYIRWKLF